MTKKEIIKKALKYLAMLKTGKSIRTQSQLAEKLKQKCVNKKIK